MQQIARWIKYRAMPHGLILLYHRVADLPNDPSLLAVKPEHFSQQMEIIRSYCHPIPLRQMAQELQARRLTNRALAITFDDGYADNFLQALPVLEHYEIPATVFIASGQVGSQREFWWDELDRLILQPGTIPDRLSLSIDGATYLWKADDMGNYSLETYQRYRDWHIERLDYPHPRHRLFRELYTRIHSLPDPERQKILDELRAQIGVAPSGRSTHRSMTNEEIVLIDKGGLVEVGDHTISHSDLTALSPTGQYQEIQQSKRRLEAILNHPVDSFAYPYGFNTSETIAILKEIGFLYACATLSDVVWPKADCYKLPRLGVRDWDKQEFAHWLSWWMNG